MERDLSRHGAAVGDATSPSISRSPIISTGSRRPNATWPRCSGWASCCAAAGLPAVSMCGSRANCAPAAAFISRAPRLAVDGGLRLGHRFVDSANGETVTWIAERWDLPGGRCRARRGRRDRRPARRLGGTGGRAASGAESTAGFIPTARGRVKPGDLDADGRFALAAIVHRFTDACLQAARGDRHGCGEFLEANRRGFSTFELALRISGALALDEPYLVESGIAHLGNSSLRLIHRMPTRAAAARSRGSANTASTSTSTRAARPAGPTRSAARRRACF